MLVDISIRGFVLIDRLELSPVDGFTALTGETGAGKSIILDALWVALGGTAERRMVRQGDESAVVGAAFSLAESHPVWPLLDAAGIDADPDEMLTLKRVIPVRGAIRAYVNDQPVSAGKLREIGETLVEIHGQHAAMQLLRPANHMGLLDRYAGNEGLLSACADAWSTLQTAREARAQLEADRGDVAARLETIMRDIAAIDEIGPQPGEAETLATERAILTHGQRLRDGLADAGQALGDGAARQAIAAAARAIERLCRLPGVDGAEAGLGAALRQLGDTLEQALIETDEAEAMVARLSETVDGDERRLEAVEARLFAIRGLARRFGVDADALSAFREGLEGACLEADAGDDALEKARDRERDASALWHTQADRLTAARTAAARRLEAAIRRELKPLRMGGVKLRFAIAPSAGSAAGSGGQDRVEIEVETSKDCGYGPLAKIASGGELSRVSLAIQCALADRGGVPVLVFDEADQGVGGAVAAAIGDRLARLGAERQVFAVTHSPQVAAASDEQLRIEKRNAPSGAGQTQVSRLDEEARREEVARMLSGRTVTDEARQAAARLLEGTCRREHR